MDDKNPCCAGNYFTGSDSLSGITPENTTELNSTSPKVRANGWIYTLMLQLITALWYGTVQAVMPEFKNPIVFQDSVALQNII
ncbi:hypothetical protein [Methanoplanus endosymbiosus]|uniref:Uncharacterized protein n=1 Tax=Methanoplanus endosymbiosus TaxID=33865 RepID=A0A9E7TKY6_9EURY|nr:hypothetical protein [Methanoplanus endosymbiosus]UUX93239.1 hypothetical protein L6E24_03700 [Methanoplanus endosymbiosus]